MTARPMSVTEAVDTRMSARAFTNRPVDPALLRRILAAAARSPSGGNVQPWHVVVLGGDELARFKENVAERLRSNRTMEGEGPEYAIYPPELHDPYRSRRWKSAEDMYGTMGITREDKPARYRFIAGNYQFWGAPVAMFTLVDRRMGPPQWSDLGMFLQTFMLLAREAGLHTCAQEAWTNLHRTVGELIAIPPEQMLFCGMAIGWRDETHPVNRLRTERAPLGEFASFRGI
jgi:nitroreductase